MIEYVRRFGIALWSKLSIGSKFNKRRPINISLYLRCSLFPLFAITNIGTKDRQNCLFAIYNIEKKSSIIGHMSFHIHTYELSQQNRNQCNTHQLYWTWSTPKQSQMERTEKIIIRYNCIEMICIVSSYCQLFLYVVACVLYPSGIFSVCNTPL